ncbi:RNA methyltransferase [bacterium]|nr:RNA methyltransferase [bacterium]
MEEITSLNNSLVKETAKLHQKKYRDAENNFILEGFKAVEEAVLSGINIEYAFILSGKADRYKFFEGRKILTTEAVLKKISDVDSAPEVVAVAKQKHYKKSDFKGLKKIILLENIKDLGNLGTIIRSACAFNIDGIVLYGDCADLYSPKCVRSAVGNLWKIPVITLNKTEDLKELFLDYQRVATLPLAKHTLKNFKPNDKILVMFGSEADGLSEELKAFATESVKIEMSKKVESLNLAVSCAVIMYYLN